MSESVSERPGDLRPAIEPTDPDLPDAVAILRLYLVELIERYERRPTSDEEVAQAQVLHGSDDLRPPSGVFLLARSGGGGGDGDGTVAGCIGLRWLDSETGELTRMFVHPEMRRRGVASRLIEAVEDVARQAGAVRMRLDTRKDLIEARALYLRHGYVEIDDYNGDSFADHWFEKRLV